MARQIYTTDILNAYDAFEGEDVGAFIDAWDSYLRGDDVPCVSADGLHKITDYVCTRCGREYA